MSARDLPEHEARAAELVARLCREYLAPPPRQSVSEWAVANRILSAKDSSEPGPYRIERTPYAREPQDELSHFSPTEEVVLMWGAQTSKTTIGMNWIGSLIELQPGPVMAVLPTIDTGKRFSRQRLVPMIEESPSLRRKVKDNRSRDDANTTLLKEFAGGFVIIAGANSAAGLRSAPIRDIYFDEIDAYPLDVDGEGDPISLAEARQTTFARRKRLKTSTPTTKGFSRVEAAFLATDRRYFHVACPHCGQRQRLEWGADSLHGIKWRKEEGTGRPLPSTAHYVCISGCIIEEHAKTAMLAGGAWVPQNPAAHPKKRGYHLSSLYSPLGWLSWEQLVREWLEAKEAVAVGDVSKLRAFVNTRLAETFEEQGAQADHHELARRAEPYEMGVVPMGGLMLTGFADVQGDRIELRVWAWGRGEESWLVERHIIPGDPLIPEGEPGSPWTRLTDIRRTPIAHASGRHMMIEACGVDSGYQAHAVYNYCRTHAHAHVLATKGMPGAQRPVLGKPSVVDVTWRGKTMPRGLKLWPIGADTAKHLIFGRLRLTSAGHGYVHLPAKLREDPHGEFEQLTAERLVTKYHHGRARMEWHKAPGKRNEALDCFVGSYAMACYMGIQALKEPGWARREQLFAPREPDLFGAAAAGQGDDNDNNEAATSTAKQRPAQPARPAGRQAVQPKRGGFVKGWR